MESDYWDKEEFDKVGELTQEPLEETEERIDRMSEQLEREMRGEV